LTLTLTGFNHLKEQLSQLLAAAINALITNETLAAGTPTQAQVTDARDKTHGDFASNICMVLAKKAGKNPRELAQLLIDNLPEHADLEKVEIAGPGFINFFVKQSTSQSIVKTILEQKENWGKSNIGAGKKIQVEFVSANPTGPLHVGHGRGAAYGATVADLLAAVGYNVHREYYVNDAGRQMDILATSVWLRYLHQCGEDIVFPSNGYKGDYVFDIASTAFQENGDKFLHPAAAVFANVHPDEPEGDKEKHIDDLIGAAKKLLGEKNYSVIFDLALNTLIDDIRQDLEAFGIHYDTWFSEKSLSNHVEGALEKLQNSGFLYEKEGAVWFKSTQFGDEKDRVVKRNNGQTTYFASDIAYHLNKFERGFEQVIDIWGADHHGYVPRVKAALSALGKKPEALDVLLVQFAILYQGGKRLQMSTRSGEFVTLKELREEVGADAARFFYVMRKAEQHMDFDMDLAKSESSDNPVYYVQYAHARICSVLRQLKEKELIFDKDNGLENLNQLTESHEQALIKKLSQFADVIKSAATKHEPHQLTYYLRELANDFHTYYNAHQFLVEDNAIRNARLCLIKATQQTLLNGLSLVGVTAPETM